MLIIFAYCNSLIHSVLPKILNQVVPSINHAHHPKETWKISLLCFSLLKRKYSGSTMSMDSTSNVGPPHITTGQYYHSAKIRKTEIFFSFWILKEVFASWLFLFLLCEHYNTYFDMFVFIFDHYHLSHYLWCLSSTLTADPSF